MNAYLYKHQIIRLAERLNANYYRISTDEKDEWTHYVEVNEQRAKELEEEWSKPIPPTPEPEIPAEEKRREAYKLEADPYLIAYQGYELEGNIEKAEEQKMMYLSIKEDIRNRYPDENIDTALKHHKKVQ